MKIVLDANIFLSAAIRKGKPHRIVQASLVGADFEVSSVLAKSMESETFS